MSDLGWAKRIKASGEKLAGRARVLNRDEAAVPALPDAAAEADRRLENRREPNPRRAFAPLERIREPRNWFPDRWPWLIAATVASIIGSAIVLQDLPGKGSLAALLLALLGLLNVGRFYSLAEDRVMARRLLGTFMVVVGPLALLGYGFASWASEGGIGRESSLVVLISISTIAAVYLHRNAGVLLAALAACWAGPALINATPASLVVASVGLALATAAAAELVRREGIERSVRESRHRSQARARGILTDFEESGQGWFWETDRRGLLTYVSPRVAHAIGVRSDRVIGQPLDDLFDLDQTGEDDVKALHARLNSTESFHDLHLRAATATGVECWWSVSGRPVFDDGGQFVGYRGSGTDLTERKRSQADAVRLARYDSLTGLNNRLQMTRALEATLTHENPQLRACAVMLLDLDRFKQVNDTMGHPAGDELLKQVAERVKTTVGSRGQVGRLGGDEFQILLPSLIDTAALEELARNVITAVSEHYMIEGQRVVIGVSIGIARAPLDGENGDEVIRNADLALYAAKDGGRGRFYFYSDDLHEAAEDRAQMEKDLRSAITNGDLQVFYQPVVSTASESITGFEALLRWKHATKGWIPPSRFIERAEDAGLIEEIGEWVLHTACRDLSGWPEHIRVSVNVSPLQFADEHLADKVKGAIQEAGIEASRLELEITESVFLAEDRCTDNTFAQLKSLGVRLALDDFGTGYSSLGYLKRAPFDKIKIDRSFLHGATDPASPNGAIIAAITSLAHALGMETAAEGVETVEELDLVRMHGCSHVQGFIYEHPLDILAATERLRTGLPTISQGDQAKRAPRRAIVRKVTLTHKGQSYDGTIRNISPTGALIEGLWNVPAGTEFYIGLPDNRSVRAVTRWCTENRMGVEFLQPEEARQPVGLDEISPERAAALARLRKAG